VLGVLEAYGSESLAESDTLEILRSLTNQAASALENARLYGELAEREGQLKGLVGKLIVVQEEERRRVAYEIHDGLTQMLVAAHQHLQSFADYHPPDTTHAQEELDRVLDLAQRAVVEARSVIGDLRPTALDDFGLGTALRLQVEALRAEGWQIGYKETLGANRLPPQVETALFRVAQEALTNVRKHAQTTRVDIELRRLVSGESITSRRCI
jgi:signal transduction histidine kinase